MKKYTFKEKAILMTMTILAFIAAFLFFQRFQPETFMKKAGEPVGMEDIEADTAKSYTGKTAGEDIPRIASAGAFEGITGGEYVTAVPVSVTETGIYSLKPWVDPYDITKGRTSRGRTYSTGRKAPEVTDMLTADAEYYREYYLIELEDSSFILAQFSASYRKEIEKGEQVTLPIGLKKTNSDAAKSALEGICEEYHADNTYTLYMADDEWDQDNYFTVFIVRFGVSALVFFVIAILLFLGAGKVFRIEF